MFEAAFIFHLNDKYFGAVYPVDYYNDKKVFFDSGSRQFFAMYQILRNRQSVLTIEDNSTGSRLTMNNENEFKQWVSEHYPMYINYLENYN
jgi:hypothetical protein